MLNPAQPSSWLGTPGSSGIIRPFRMPRLVIIDLGALYGRARHFRRPNITVLPSLSVQVVGLLDAWLLTEDGWYGACRYKVKLAHAQFVDQDHLVPARMIRAADDREVEVGRMRGEIQLHH
jgi:hypothetical protein